MFSELINEHCVEKLDMKCDGGGAEKLRRRRDWSVDDFDAVEIQRSKSTKFDGAGVLCKHILGVSRKNTGKVLIK